MTMGSGTNRIESIDKAVDDWWDRRLRGRPALDRIMYSASEAATIRDSGTVWGRRKRQCAGTAASPRE